MVAVFVGFVSGNLPNIAHVPLVSLDLYELSIPCLIAGSNFRKVIIIAAPNGGHALFGLGNYFVFFPTPNDTAEAGENVAYTGDDFLC